MKNILVLFAFALCSNATSLSQTWPAISPGQSSYTVQPSDTNLTINTLYLPDNFTLNVDPSVRTINWVINRIKIGVNATIDLSAPQNKPPRAANGAPPPGQAGYCTTGAGGAPGGNGTAGLSGVSLTIADVSNIDNQGSLWIRTDGGPGGDGGNGGNGQLGGGWRSVGAGLFHGGSCGAADGGAGGAAGMAGSGGKVAQVTIKFRDAGTTPISGGDGTVSTQCGPTQRPANAQGATGVIVIWGAPGCPGQAGVPGQHGGHG